MKNQKIQNGYSLLDTSILPEQLLAKLDLNKCYFLRLLNLTDSLAIVVVSDNSNNIFIENLKLHKIKTKTEGLSSPLNQNFNIFYDAVHFQTLQNENLELFTMAETANELRTSRPKLFTFLKKFNWITDKRICPELIENGFFVERTRKAWYGSFPKKYIVFLATNSGVEFLSRFAKLTKYNKL